MELSSPAAFWLFPVALILLLAQLYRARRREFWTGSLVLWRRVAARQPPAPRRRLRLDRRFWLQAAVLASLLLALAGPRLRRRTPPAARLLLMLDNGPTARARTPDGRPLWDSLADAADQALAQLDPSDRVLLMAAAPFPARLTGEADQAGTDPAAAREALRKAFPALSGPASPAVLESALAAARGLGGPAAVLVISPRPVPRRPAGGTEERNLEWRVALPERVAGRLDNVGLTAFGSEYLVTESKDFMEAEVLVQVRSFRAGPARGRVVLEEQGEEAHKKEERLLALEPGEAAGVAFRIRARRLPRLELFWRSEDGGYDALPEDDTLTAMPARSGPPRVRWHGSAPHVEDLYREALQAELLEPDGTLRGGSGPARAGPTDLEVYVDATPDEAPADCRGALFLAPARSFGAFEVLAGADAGSAPQLGDPDPLTRDLKSQPEFAVAEARRLQQSGDWKVLLRDSAGAPLLARFRLPGGRPACVLGFVPGAGAPRERKLAPPLAAILIRFLLEAAGAREPYAVRAAAELEHARGAPLPPAWRPAYEQEAGQGVLDARASEVLAGACTPPRPAILRAEESPVSHPLWPYLVLLALGLLLLEFRAERRRGE